MHGPEVALWQRFLTSRGIYSGAISGTFDDRTSVATVEYQKRSRIEADGLVGPATIERARRDGFVPPSSRPDRGHFTTKGGVVLSSLDRSILTQVAYDYYLWTGEDLMVTSGTRTPKAQAQAMYYKLMHGGISAHFYKNHQTYEEILAAYNAARKARANEQATVDAMTRAIDRQVSKGIYISLHLRGEAVDVRTRGMSSDDEKVLDEAVRRVLGDPKQHLLRETDHFHLQF